MSFMPLSTLLADGRDAGAPVAAVADRVIDFARFRRDVAWNAARLREIGSRRSLIVGGDCYWGAVGLMATLHAGATAILPQTLQPDSRDRFDADCVVADGSAPIGDAAPLRHHRLQPGTAGPDRLDGLDPTSSRIELYTAGSTGRPKRVVKTLADMETEAAAIHETLGTALAPGSVYATVPYHHLYGLTFRLVWPLCAGWPIVARTHPYWEALAREMTPTAILVTSPAHLTRMRGLRLAAAHRPQLVLSAGAALSDAAAGEAASILGTPVTDIFGSSETGVIAYRRRAGAPVPWRPFPGVKTRRLEDGRLAVQSRHVSQDTTDGWFQTADLVAMQPDGTFELQGRADRILKIEGNRVSLAEIEQALQESPLVEAAAVVALDGDASSLGAAVLLTAQGRGVLDEIGAFRLGRKLRLDLTGRFEPAGLPRRWRFPDRLPEAMLGKRRKSDIAALFAGSDAPSEPEVRSLRAVAGGVELDLFLPATLLPLRGHFPGLPVLPGVAQIDWAVRYAAEHLDAPCDAGQAFQIKFRRLISAPSLVTLTLLSQPEQRRIQFEYRQGDTILSLGSFRLQAQR